MDWTIDWTVISYVLALVLGAVCFVLVKRTADEYDRWYEAPRLRALVAPLPMAAVAAVLVIAFIVSGQV
jgi:amino acid transporter